MYPESVMERFFPEGLRLWVQSLTFSAPLANPCGMSVRRGLHLAKLQGVGLFVSSLCLYQKINFFASLNLGVGG